MIIISTKSAMCPTIPSRPRTPNAIATLTLLPRVQMSGFKHADDDEDQQQDIMVNLFEDGTALLHVPVGSNSSSTSDLTNGFNGPGFKISFTTRVKTQLTAAHQQEMAQALAEKWAYYANAEEAVSMDEVIGFVEVEHRANFYYRIISEQVTSFGLNYESVDICGGMSDYL